MRKLYTRINGQIFYLGRVPDKERSRVRNEFRQSLEVPITLSDSMKKVWIDRRAMYGPSGRRQKAKNKCSTT